MNYLDCKIEGSLPLQVERQPEKKMKDLPTEIINKMASFLDEASVLRLSRTSKTLQNDLRKLTSTYNVHLHRPLQIQKIKNNSLAGLGWGISAAGAVVCAKKIVLWNQLTNSLSLFAHIGNLTLNPGSFRIYKPMLAAFGLLGSTAAAAAGVLLTGPDKTVETAAEKVFQISAEGLRIAGSAFLGAGELGFAVIAAISGFIAIHQAGIIPPMDFNHSLIEKLKSLGKQAFLISAGSLFIGSAAGLACAACRSILSLLVSTEMNPVEGFSLPEVAAGMLSNIFFALAFDNFLRNQHMSQLSKSCIAFGQYVGGWAAVLAGRLTSSITAIGLSAIAAGCTAAACSIWKKYKI